MIVAVTILIAFLAAACSDTSPLPIPPGNNQQVLTLSSYRLGPSVGSSITHRFTTRDSSGDGTTEIVGSDYRFTLVDTAFAFPGDKRTHALRRETITNGVVRLTDTTYHWAGTADLMLYERLTDTIGRRRLATPLEPGTRFLLRDNLGWVEANTYVIQSLNDTVITRGGVFTRCAHARMESSTSDGTQSTQFSDEFWLAPNYGVVRQLQTRIVTNLATGSRGKSVLEFELIARSR